MWGYADSRAHHNVIASNHIHDLGKGVLSDTGGVYTLGVCPGTVVEGNHIHDITSHDYGGFHQHYGRDNTIENNVFAIARDWQIQRTRVEDHTSFVFRRNIVWWTTDVPLVKGDWTKGVVT